LEKVLSSSLDSYQILKKIGQGGMGTAYLVSGEKHRQDFVLKVLDVKEIEDWEMIEHFEREAKVLSQLDHPNIPDYVDYFTNEESGTYILVQEFVDGQTVQKMMDDDSLVTEEKFRAYFLQILEALAYLHKLVPPIIHRDLSPNNIMISEDKAYLIDFGNVKNAILPAGQPSLTSIGTYGYMAPEQMLGHASAASDLYGLGMTFIAFATRHRPSRLFDEKTGRLDFTSLLKHIPADLTDILQDMVNPDLPTRLHDAGQILKKLVQPARKQAKKETKDAAETKQVERLKREQRKQQERLEALEKAARKPAKRPTNVILDGKAKAEEIRTGTVTIKTEEDLLEYVQTDPNWYDFLLKDPQGYNLLLNWFYQRYDLRFKKVMDGMFRYYLAAGTEYVYRRGKRIEFYDGGGEKCGYMETGAVVHLDMHSMYAVGRKTFLPETDLKGPDYIREALVRFFRPETPLRLEEREYDFCHATDPQQLFQEFMLQFATWWKKNDMADIRFKVFELEFVLRQTMDGAAGSKKEQLREILTCFWAQPPSHFSSFKATYFNRMYRHRLFELLYNVDAERALASLGRLLTEAGSADGWQKVFERTLAQFMKTEWTVHRVKEKKGRALVAYSIRTSLREYLDQRGIKVRADGKSHKGTVSFDVIPGGSVDEYVASVMQALSEKEEIDLADLDEHPTGDLRSKLGDYVAKIVRREQASLQKKVDAEIEEQKQAQARTLARFRSIRRKLVVAAIVAIGVLAYALG